MMRDGVPALVALFAFAAVAVLWASPLQTRRLERSQARKAEYRMSHGPFETQRDRDP
jgi:hypothetical protein